MPIRVLLALVALASTAAAHTQPIRHRLLGSARLDGAQLRVDVMLWMQVPKGVHAERLMARFDLLRNGRLDPPEARALADEQGPEVVGGFVLRADGRPVKPRSAESTARLEPDGAIAVAVLLGYALPAPAPAPSEGTRLALTLRAAPRGDAHEREHAAEWSVLPPLRLVGARDGVVGPVPLVPGPVGVEVRVAPPPAN